MLKITVTGGAGYIGSVLVPTLLSEGHEVTVLDNFMFGQTTLLESCINPKFNIIRGDCRDKSLIREAIKNADYIIPLAALVGAPLCKLDQVTSEIVNLGSIKSLLELKSPQQKIIYPTTNSGYGIGEKGKFCTEETPLKPISLYGTTKVTAEKMVLDKGNSITLRLATVFGASPRMRIDLLVNDFVHRAINERAIVIFESHFKRNFIHIRDVTRAFQHAMANFEKMQGNAFNVGLSDANLSKFELCQKIAKHVPGFVYIEAPIGEDPDKRDYIVSNEKIEKTGFKPAYSLDSGIQELLKSYKIIRNSRFGNV